MNPKLHFDGPMLRGAFASILYREFITRWMCLEGRPETDSSDECRETLVDRLELVYEFRTDGGAPR